MNTDGLKIVPIDLKQAELAERVANLAPLDGVHRTALDAIACIRASDVSLPLPAVYSPSLCIVVQGRKRALIGNETYHYDAFNHLLVSVTLPMKGQIIEASPERPYLCMRLNVDVSEVAKLLTEMPMDNSIAETNKPFYVARTTPDLVEVILRLVRLLDSPIDLPVLAPLALRELWYRLLRGEMGPRLRGLVEIDGQVQRVGRAIEYLQSHYNQPLRIENLANASHMSASTFHARFKAVTTLSPLQFQKQLRLHEARRLLLIEHLDATSAAHQVGYESPSQFNREYRRFFGAPPRREIAKLRAG